jgi:hypothetical protein
MIGEQFELFGFDLFGDPVKQAGIGALAARFLVPPFSVLDARQGYWQERKRAWLALGIESELGRADALLAYSDQTLQIDFYAQKRKLEAEAGRMMTKEEAAAVMAARNAEGGAK